MDSDGKSAAPDYQQICKGKKRSFLWRQTCTLWKGRDHFLLVTNNLLVERYQRFYFRDIQGISVLPRKSWPYQLAGLLLFGTLPMAPVVFLFRDDVPESARYGFMIVAGVIFLLFFILFLVMLAKGRTCLCRFHTAVQTEEIGAINRLHVAEQHLPGIRNFIEAAQLDGQPQNQGGETAVP